MAWIEPVKGGRFEVWRIRWTDARTGLPDGERFSSRFHGDRVKDVAEAFRALIERAPGGDTRPDGYPVQCAPFVRVAPNGAVTLEGLVADDETPQTWDAVHAEYARTKTKAAPAHRARKALMWAEHFADIQVMSQGRLVRVGSLRPAQLTPSVALHIANTLKASTFRACYGKCKRKVCDHELMTRAPKTVRNIYAGSIKPVIDYARRMGFYEDRRDPFGEIEWATVIRRPVTLQEVPTGDEIEAWIWAAYKATAHMPDPFLAGDVATVLLSTGMRWSELSALRWKDVESTLCLARIRQVVKYDEMYRPYLDTQEGKSHRAFRTVGISYQALAVLSRRAIGKADDALLFEAAKGGPMRNSSFRDRYWCKVRDYMAKHGEKLGVTPHKLRHAYITHLILDGMPIQMVAELAGQDPAITAEVYTHATEQAVQRAAATMAKAIGGTPVPV